MFSFSLRELNSPARPLQPAPAYLLFRLIPVAYGVFLAGFMTSAAVRLADRPPTLEAGIMSDLLSRIDNPRGYLFSAMATVMCGVLLLPAAALFQRGWSSPPGRWAILGAWLYRVGLIAAIAVGATTPLQRPYVALHIWLTFLAFMSLVAGLAVSLAVAACSATAVRFPLAALGALQMGALFFLTYVFLGYLGVVDDCFEGRRWFLAVCEWGLSALIAAGTVAVAGALAQASKLRRDSGETTQPDGAAIGSQPIRSETKPTSSAAGSGR